MIKQEQIIAIGGGGFSEEPENPLLDLYVLKQASLKNPKICFLPTASGDSDSYIEKFYKSFSQYECEPSHLSLFRPHTSDMEGFLLSQNIIYVGGGNTKTMLAIWKEWSIDEILKKALKLEIVLAGISAGAICWFEQGATDSIPGKISALPCLGFLENSCCPHFDGEPLRAETVPELVKGGAMKPCYAIDNGAAVHFINGEFKRAVSSVNGKRVSYIKPDAIKTLDVHFLSL